MINTEYLWRILARVAVLFTCLPIHECAHGYVAYRLGDNTAKEQHRLTLNPLRHVDFLGMLSLVLLGFGWAKPVPVSPWNFRGDRRRGMALTAAAGPAANLLLALALMILFRILSWAFYLGGVLDSSAAQGIRGILAAMIWTNVSLCVFNLLPINPLDGSRIIGLLLPERVYGWLMRHERVLFAVLLVVLVTGILDTPLQFLSGGLMRALDFLTSFVDFFGRLFIR